MDGGHGKFSWMRKNYWETKVLHLQLASSTRFNSYEGKSERSLVVEQGYTSGETLNSIKKY